MRHYIGTRPFLIDLGGILLLFILGGVGIAIMAAPHWIFPAFVPMLSPRDWPVVEAQPETRLYSKETARQQSHFNFYMSVEEPGNWSASIKQELFWYADTVQAAHMWQMDTADAAGYPFVTTFPSVTQPSHLFACRQLDENRRLCTYYAYAGHYYMLVRLSSENDALLPLEQMKQLASLAGERFWAKAGTE